jgi:pre-mRNA-splicing factor ATP-dependent RNA helicase DHX15/PRP43
LFCFVLLNFFIQAVQLLRFFPELGHSLLTFPFLTFFQKDTTISSPSLPPPSRRCGRHRRAGERRSTRAAAAAAAMGTEWKRKVRLCDASDDYEASLSALSARLSRVSINGVTAAANPPSVNPWSGRPYSARYLKLLEKRQELPVWQHKDEFLRALRDNQTLLLVGETGCGKTTQVVRHICDPTLLRLPLLRKLGDLQFLITNVVSG